MDSKSRPLYLVEKPHLLIARYGLTEIAQSTISVH